MHAGRAARARHAPPVVRRIVVLSALGTPVAIASLIGELDMVGGVPDASGVAQVTVTGPLYYRGPTGGAFGNLCTRVTSCSGLVDW